MHHAPGCKYRPTGKRTQRFQSQAYCNRAKWPYCDFTSSDDDEHNTDNNFLLLFADVDITPTLLKGLTEVDVLHIAVGCRLAFSRSCSNFPLHLSQSHFLTILSSPHSEQGRCTCFKTVTLANLFGPCSWKGTHTLTLTPCGRNTWLHSVNSRHVDLHNSCTARFEWLQFPSTTGAPGGDDNPTLPLSLRDAGMGATRSCTVGDHTFPSCLVAHPLAKMEYRTVNTLVLPHPWLTQQTPMTFPACALYQLFVRSCVLAHHGLYCSNVCAYSISLWCLPSLFFSSQMEKQQCVRPPLGTTEWNHSYYTGNSLSALHSLQQLQAGASCPSSVQMSASCELVWVGLGWFGLVGLVGLVWFGLVWFGLVWFGLVWFGLVWVWVWVGLGLVWGWCWVGWLCGGVLVVLGTQLLSVSARGCSPQHQGRGR